MKPHNPPPATYAFGYREPPQPGNEINGLGIKEKIRAKHVFHDPGGGNLPWHALDEFFSYIAPGELSNIFLPMSGSCAARTAR